MTNDGRTAAITTTAAAATTTATIQLLGGACLRSGDTVLAGPPAQRHRVALLALVVHAWPQPLARDRALALLWPERDEAGGRRLLNLAVHVLRSALGDETIVSLGDGLLFDPARVRCDLHELRAAIAADDPERVVRCWAGPLLDGFHLPESGEFAHWLDGARDELAHAYRRALVALAERRERAGDAHGLVDVCRRLVAADPHSAECAKRLMRALDAAGDRAAAIQHAAEHARRLRADLELEPDASVLALAEALRRAPAAGGRAERVHPTVAVLPFRDIGGIPDRSFADGITEDVIAHLSRIRALRVISRASVLPFHERRQGLGEIGRALGAAVVLDGSVRRSGDRLRIVAALVDVRTERQLWSATYDRRLVDVFEIQTDVALRIAAALEAELSPEEHARLRRAPTADLEAYQLYVQGRRWFTRYERGALERAAECYRRAVERDPEFALAYASLGMAYVELAEHGAPEPASLYRRAAEAAATALGLDPDSSEAHGTMGSVKLAWEYDWAGADFHLRRMLELKPGSGDAHERYGRLCTTLGRHDEAVAMMQRAQELDPLTNRIDLATMLVRAGRYDEAVLRARHAVEFDDTQARAHATLGWALLLGGRRDDGVRALERAVAVSGAGDTLWRAQLGEAYGLAGRTEQAREVLCELEARARSSYVSPYHLAYVHTGLGEADRALDLLERAVAERTGPTYSIKGSFLFAPLRGHPRFQALVRAMNLG